MGPRLRAGGRRGLPHLNPDLEETPPALRRRLNRRPRLYRAGFASVRALQCLLAVSRIDSLRRLRLAQLRRPDDDQLAINRRPSSTTYSGITSRKPVLELCVAASIPER